MAEEKVKAEPKKDAPMPMDKAATPAKDKPAKKSSPEALMTSESPKKDAKAGTKGSKKGGFTHTHVDHHSHGGHTVRHHHKDGADKDVAYSAQDLEGVKAGLDHHIGGGAGQMMEAPPEPAMAAEPAAPPAGAMPPAAPQV